MAAALLLISAALIVAGTAVIYWPAALIVAGVIGMVAGIDLARAAPFTRRTPEPIA